MDRYYYKINQITVCLVVDGKQAARGIAICSPLDTFSLSIGGKIAFKNAMRAMGNSKQLRPIVDWRARKTLLESDCPFVRKGEINPVLTWREVKMVKGVKEPFVFSRTRLDRFKMWADIVGMSRMAPPPQWKDRANVLSDIRKCCYDMSLTNRYI